jgi:hypothetical protein
MRTGRVWQLVHDIEAVSYGNSHERMHAVHQLAAVLDLVVHKANPKPFVQTKTADDIMNSIKQFSMRIADL